MANIPNANQYRSRNPNGASSSGNRPTSSRHQDPEAVSSGWSAALVAGIIVGVVLLRIAGPFLAALGAVLSAVMVANLSK